MTGYRVGRLARVLADQVLQDVRYAVRQVRRGPGFTLVVVATLALGIGLTTAVFSVVNAVLLRPLAYRNGDRLVWIVTYDDRYPFKSIEVVTAQDFLAFREHASTLDRVVAFFIGMERLTTRDGVVAARVATVSTDFWDLSGAVPSLGRLPATNEEAVVLSYGLFERAFQGDPTVVGRLILVNDRQLLVAGVLPPAFHPQLPPPSSVSQLSVGEIEAYHVTIIRPPAPTDLGVRVFNVIARMKPSVTVAHVTAELDAVRADVRRAYPTLPAGAPRLRVTPFADVLVGGARRPLLILFGCVAVVLAIACANTASLQLARASTRRKEVAVRVAIGAGRGRVMRQFMVESLLLCAAGGVAGVVVARGALSTMIRLLPYAIPRLAETTVDGRVLGFAVAATVLTAFACGITPAAALWRMNVQDTLKDGARTATATAGVLRARRGLVVGELALASILVVSAILLVKSFWRITSYPPGFTPDHVLTMKVQLSGASVRSPERKRAYLDEALRQAQALPGVVAAGVTSDGDARIRFVRQDGPPTPIVERPTVRLDVTSEGYASAVGMRIVQGRWLTDDEPSAVYVINEALARRYFVGESPIGRRLLLPTGADPARAVPIPIVGVVADLRDANLEAAVEPELFTDYRHSNPFAMTIAVRTTADPMLAASAIRARLATIDRTQALFEVKRLDVALADSIAPRRLTLMLLGTFATAALLLAIVGVYGVMAYTVTQRTQEIGVRMALGAAPLSILMMVVRQGMTVAAAGLAGGTIGALAVTRVFVALLYDVAPTDVTAFLVAVFGITVTACAACSVPALRASLVDPVTALRCE